MRMRKKIISGIFTGVLLLGGCAEFRELFDEPPQKKQKTLENRQRRRESKRNLNDRSGRDPVRDMFGMKKESAPVLQESDLSSFERRMIDEQRRSGDTDIQTIREQNEKARKSRRDWVFGKNPFE